jgi:hypothetical protein
MPVSRRWRLRNDLGFEGGLSVSRHLDLDRPDFGEHGFGPVPVTGVASISAGWVAGGVAEMVAELAFEGVFEDHLGQFLQQPPSPIRLRPCERACSTNCAASCSSTASVVSSLLSVSGLLSAVVSATAVSPLISGSYTIVFTVPPQEPAATVQDLVRRRGKRREAGARRRRPTAAGLDSACYG